MDFRTLPTKQLDVDINELDAGVRTTYLDTEHSRLLDVQAFLTVRLENGAGYCTWLSEPENFRNLLTHAEGRRIAANIARLPELLGGRAAGRGT